MAKPNQSTSRAGTSGFRAFEVLLKCPNQYFALDIWSGGIIFLSLLSRKYPFFKGRDDMAYIMQIIVLFGSTKCVETARRNSTAHHLNLAKTFPLFANT